MSEAFFIVSGVTKRFAGLVAVDNISFDVKRGELVSIIEEMNGG